MTATTTILLGLAISFSTLAINAVKEIISSRLAARSRREDFWNNAIAWARVIEDDDESITVRLVARRALEEVGISQSDLDELKQERHRNDVAKLWSPQPKISSDDEAAVRKALEQPPTMDPDIVAVSKFFRFEKAFAEAKAAGKAEDDTRIRIFFVAAMFAAAFSALAIGAIRAVIY